MKTRTRTFTVVIATAASASMLTALALGGGSSAAPSTPSASTYVVPMTTPDMTSMMGTSGMMGAGGTMSGVGMDAMHDAMHQSLKGKVSDDVLAACDKAHDAMVATSSVAPVGDTTAHSSHHLGGRP